MVSDINSCIRWCISGSQHHYIFVYDYIHSQCILYIFVVLLVQSIISMFSTFFLLGAHLYHVCILLKLTCKTRTLWGSTNYVIKFSMLGSNRALKLIFSISFNHILFRYGRIDIEIIVPKTSLNNFVGVTRMIIWYLTKLTGKGSLKDHFL